MTDLMDVFLNAVNAFNVKKYEVAVELLTKVIDAYYSQPLNDVKKGSLIKLLKKRIDALFCAKRYDYVLLDIEKLKTLGVNIENDPNLSSINFKSLSPTYSFNCAKEVKIQENKCK